MKTAISVEDELLSEADRYAKKSGLSRSRLLSLALREYLDRRRQKDLLERLNQAYGGEPDPTEVSAAQGIKAKFRTTIQDRW